MLCLPLFQHGSHVNRVVHMRPRPRPPALTTPSPRPPQVEAFLAEQAGSGSEGEEDYGDHPPNLSAEMSEFLGGVTYMPRFTVVKKLWEHIKANNLQVRRAAAGRSAVVCIVVSGCAAWLPHARMRPDGDQNH